MEKPPFLSRQPVQAAMLYLPLWAACTFYLALSGGNFLFPISSLLLFGVILTGAAIFLTRKTDAPPVPVAEPKRESIVLLLYLLLYALVLFGPLASVVRNSIVCERAEQVAMLAYKLIVHVLIPALLARSVKGRLAGIFDTGLGRRGVVPALLLFSTFMLAVAGLLNSIFEQLSAAGLSVGAIAAWAALAWLWMSLEAGLCEEFLFRALLQSRLTAWSGSPAMAIVLTAIIFALVHVPSFYLRGGEALAKQASTLPQIAALAIGSIAPISILFGTLWYRTRSLLLIVLVHGAVDALPAIDKMMRIWG
jgi:membrane protease YdiL (CAAX protease family)